MAEIENKVSQKDKKRWAKAQFSYTPVNTDELQLKVNDILEVIEETEEGWWKGILNGAVGMFPSNFVIEMDNHPEELTNHTVNDLSPSKSFIKNKNLDIHETSLKHDISHSPSTKRDMKSASINSNKEDAVDSFKISDSGDKKGFVNKKNVDVTAPRLPPKPVREQARVIYPYTALNEDELSLKEGDIITVISKEVEDKGWWKGELNNRTGVFPDNFVQLIKVEEQKKPERPDKPPSALTSRASLKSSSSDKGVPEFSPKIERKVLKTPPVKPPPPEIHKKEHDKTTPPFPIKKPQIPHPMKKPSRPSIGSKFAGFSPPSTINSVKPPVPEAILPPPLVPVPPPPVIPTSEAKSDTSRNIEKIVERDSKREIQSRDSKRDSKRENQERENKRENSERDIKRESLERNSKREHQERDIKRESLERNTKRENQDLGFEGLESSGKKLVHLTANRAKVPNRRPPSHVFLKESEKENGISLDPRRLSEPLLSEMKLIHQHEEVDSHKKNVTVVNEVKAKVPPSRPLPPSIKGNKPAIQGSVILTKTISSEECIVKAPEPIKKMMLPDASVISGSEILQPKKVLLPDVSLISTSSEIIQPKKVLLPDPSIISGSEILQPKKVDLPSSDFKLQTSEKEMQELKESLKSLMSTMVSRNEFNELAKQVKELKEGLEKCSSTCKKTINDLKTELESEKKMRQALEIELQQMKECQTT